MSISGSWKQVGWKSILTIVTLATVAFFGLICLVEWANRELIEDTIVDHTHNWDAYYESTVSKYFTIPEEAEIVSATETQHGLDRKDEVTFRLPGTKSPEQWLAEIAEASELTEYRQNKYEYDAGLVASEKRGLDKKADTCRLSYNSSTNEYHAIYAWD